MIEMTSKKIPHFIRKDFELEKECENATHFRHLP